MTQVRRRKLSAAIAAAIIAGVPAAQAQIDLSLIGSSEPGFKILGDEAGDALGTSVSGAGDIDGDLDGDQLGTSVSGAGDVNGDGLADVIVGAPYRDAGTADAGSGYVIFGTDFPADVDVQNLTGVGVRADGIANGDLAGFSVSGVGDINGDGLNDFAVGAKSYDDLIYTSYANRGSVYVIFGTGSLPTTFSLASPPAGFEIGLEQYSARIGTIVSGAGDVNGDGLEDLVVLGANAGQYGTGQAYVVFGKSDQTKVDLSAVESGSGGFAFRGESTNGLQFVSGIGDFNGDGLADLVAASQFGDAAVVFGKASNLSPVVDITQIMAGEGVDLTGVFSIADARGAGDFNGDGLNDVIIGAPDAYASGFYGMGQGVSFVVLGDSTPPTSINMANFGSTSEGLRIVGAADYDRIGTAVAGAGDFDGDGLADVMVGMADAISGNAPNGSVFIVFGKDTDTNDIVIGTAGASLRIDGESTVEKIGSAVSAAGDVDGDGLADVVIGAKDGDPERYYSYTGGGGINNIYTNAGKAYVVFSNEFPPSSALYKGIAKAGDAPELAIGTVGDGSNASTPDSRTWIDFSLGTGPGPAGSSLQGVTVHRGAPAGFSGDASAAQVYWEVSTDRNNWNSAPFTFKYLDFEIAGFNENRLTVFTSNSAMGPWQPNFSLTRQPAINQITSGVFESNFTPTGTFFALGVAPEIVIGRNDSIADGGTDAIGNRPVGPGQPALTYDVSNSGTADLTVGMPSAANLNNVANVQLTSPVSPVTVGGSASTFDVNFDVVAAGAFSFDISLTNGDTLGPVSESPYNITISGTGTVPEIDILQNTTSIADGGTDSVGNADINTPVSRTYTIENNGMADLNVGALTWSNLDNVSFPSVTVTSMPAAVVAPGGFTSATIQFDVIQDGPFTMELDIANSDSNENPYDILISGTGTGGVPEIDIQDGGMVSITDGTSKLLGELIVGRVDLDFTIHNTGTGNLDVSAPTASALSNVSGFDVKTTPTTPVPPGGSTPVAVSFFIDDFGAFSLDLSFPNTDGDESPYNFTLSGTGSDTQTFPDAGAITMGDQFGSAVAGSGNLFAVGVPGGDGDPGKVIVYLLEGTTLTIDEIIPVPAGYTAANFGASLAMEGDRLLIGAPGDGEAAAAKRGAKGVAQLLQAALYQRQGDNWVLKQPLSSGSEGSSSDGFGASVAMDGDMLVVGAPADAEMGSGAGAAYVITVDDNDNLVQSNKVTPAGPGGGFGSSVAAAGGKVGVGAPNSQVGSLISGSVSMFQMIGNNVSALGTVTGSNSGDGDGFGTSVSMDGNMLLVGSPGEDGANTNQGAAYLFQFGGAGYNQSGVVTGSQGESGFGTAVGIGDGQVAVGAPGMGNGAVMTYDFSLQLQQALQALAGQSGFGQSLSVGSGGLVVGAPMSDGSTGGAALVRDPGLIFRGGFEQE